MKQFAHFLLFVGFVACCEKIAKAPAAPELPKTVQMRPDTLPRSAVVAVLTALKTKNWEALVALVDPEMGVRFSPYAFVDTVNDIKMSPQMLRETAPPSNKGKIKWGAFDGSGDPIRLEMGPYFDKFVYDLDFLNAPQNAVNRRISTGNSINNIAAAYPNCSFSESHFAGVDKKFNGMDWRSLRLVFKKRGEKWLLVGIVHDQWTS